MDYREKFAQQVSNSLLRTFDVDDVNNIMSIIYIELENYDLSKRKTQVGFCDTTSERLLQYYAGSLLTEGKSQETVKNYILFLRRFFNEINMRFVDISSMDIKIWLAKTQKAVSLRTCENYRSYLSAFYTWLTNEEYITKNPMVKIKPIQFIEEKEEAFSDIELDILRMNITNIRDRAIFELFMASGVRVGELCGLDIKDVNFTDKSMIIKKAKGGKQREVFINDVSIFYLKKYLETRTDDCPALFITRINKRISARSIQDFMKVLGEKTNIERVHPHRCRRTFATNMYKKGMDIHTIQLLLGHSDINTTTSKYIRTNLSQLDAEYRKYS